MLKVLASISTAVLVTTLGASLAISGVRIDFKIEPSHVLPGTPAVLCLLVTNDGDQDVKLPEKLLLRVVPADGDPFIAEWGAGQEHRFSHAELPTKDRTVSAHSRREFVFHAYALDKSNGWFWDARLNTPGTYRLQVLFVDPFREEKVFHTRPFDLDTVLPVRMASTESVLVIETPRGDDARVWAQLVAMAKQRGSDVWSPMFIAETGWRDFVNEVIEKYPASSYAPFIVGWYGEKSATERYGAEERLVKIRRVLDLHPSTTARESIQLLIAGVEVQAAQEAASILHHDVKRAALFYERARSDYDALERTASDPEIRRMSLEWRSSTPAELREGDGPPDGQR
ncbi:MAG TPA: hypothetical protein VGR95_22865 [Thermoanaerobaculia bacterium]|jgi:hypothetical protein|nr:hypothetical protein [Thermoanaerobaculia bacterium]